MHCVRTMRGLQRPGARRSFSLVEVAVSTVVVGTMLVAALEAVAASRVNMRHVNDRARGMLLAQDLMAEILQQAYHDPAYSSDSWGLGADEALAGDRSLYDDVDDYDGWQESPPQLKDGTGLVWAGAYERIVTVDWVLPGNLDVSSGSATGVKRITVTVNRDDVLCAQLTALRTIAWEPAHDVVRRRGSGLMPVEVEAVVLP